MSANYGTAENGQAGHLRTGRNETDALLPKADKASSSFSKHMSCNIQRKHADLVLLFSYITTGLLDSTSIAVWGSFVSMQTGNTVYIGLGLADPTASTRWIKSGTSLLSFCLGSFLFARFHRYFSVKRRSTMVASVFLQLLCIIASAAIVTLTPNVRDAPKNGNHDTHWHVLLPIGLVAFQSAGQAVISRAVKFNALTSVVLTSIYCDLFSDAKMFAGLTENVERNQRTAAPLLLVAGAICGGLWSKSEFGVTGALWTAAILKLVVLATWTVWPAEKEGES